MKRANYKSDYNPDITMQLLQTDDGDILITVNSLSDENCCRIATSGGKLSGENLVKVCNNFSEIIDILNKARG